MLKKYSVIWKIAKGMLMIDIYTKKQDSPDWIILNDMYFNVYTGNEEISEYEAKLIQQVDKAKLTTDSISKQDMESGQSEIYQQVVKLY